MAINKTTIHFLNLISFKSNIFHIGGVRDWCCCFKMQLRSATAIRLGSEFFVS